MPLRGPLQRARLGSLSPSSEPESPSSCVRSNLDDICAGRRDHPPPRPRFVCNRHCLTALTNRLTKMACWDPPPDPSSDPESLSQGARRLARRHRRRLARAESRHRRDRRHWTPFPGRTGLMRPPLRLVRGARHACQRAGSPVRCKGTRRRDGTGSCSRRRRATLQRARPRTTGRDGEGGRSGARARAPGVGWAPSPPSESTESSAGARRHPPPRSRSRRGLGPVPRPPKAAGSSGSW